MDVQKRRACRNLSSLRAGGRSQCAGAAIEEVEPGMAPPLDVPSRRSDARRRRPSWTRLPLDGLDDLPLRAADIRDQHVRTGGLGRSAHVLGDAIDRRANDDDVGRRDALAEVGRAAVDGAQTHRLLDGRRVAPHADDLGREMAGS